MAEKVVLWKGREVTAEETRASAAAGRRYAEEAIRKAGAAKLVPPRQPIAKIVPPTPPASVPAPSLTDLSKRADDLAKQIAELEAVTASNRAHDAVKLLGKGDLAGAQAIFKNEPRAYDAYMAGVRGETYRVPVVKAAPQDNHRPAIRELVRKGKAGTAELGKLLHDPAAYAQYREMMEAGETQAIAVDVAKRAQRQPADVSEAEKAPFKRKILAAMAGTDAKAKAGIRELTAKNVVAQAAWIDLVEAGKIKLA